MAEQITRRPFLREVSRTRWFFRHPRYLRYMAREITCVFIAVYTALLVIGVLRLSQGREAYEAFLLALASPASIVFHLLALGFALPDLELGEGYLEGSSMPGCPQGQAIRYPVIGRNGKSDSGRSGKGSQNAHYRPCCGDDRGNGHRNHDQQRVSPGHNHLPPGICRRRPDQFHFSPRIIDYRYYR